VKIWGDAQLSPAIARWPTETQNVDAVPLRDIGLRDADDSQIFFAARQNDAVVISKDSDFVELVLPLSCRLIDVKLALTLPPELETRVAALAAETHREPQAVLVELVGGALEREEQRDGKLATLQSAIDEGDASGIAEDGVFDRVRERASLPARSRKRVAKC
jgi:predicted transcriptional regulator